MILGQIIPLIFGIRPEFVLFALTLLGVALFHRYTLFVSLIGLTSILIFKFIAIPDFNLSEHMFGHISMADQIMDKEMRVGEWSVLLNLLGLLIGFSILSRHFEESEVPAYLPDLLPNDWKGPLVLLIVIFVMSSFLDNIAAAMIGGTIALVVFNRKVHMGYIAAIVAASNAGGSGSVIGDTTTTLMWIEGVHPFNVLHAYIAAFTALAFFSIFASIQQDKYHRIQKDAQSDVHIDWVRLGIVLFILLCTILTNVYFDFPALGVWIAILIGAFIRKTDWKEAFNSISGAVFLVALVTCASLMPVNELPVASWQTAFSLGFVSSVFDNIPLTKLALEQNGYDWGMLAYAVGFGGSMIWFGSSAGVAITTKFHEARSVFDWLKSGWHIAVAYVLGFFVLLLIWGWDPEVIEKKDNSGHEAIPTEQLAPTP
ncbi:MAG TPA: citrate transporter [Prolixibacteraceae bacterium]|nr:citrate transporter [Prolixibacteraceae bacterium]